MLSLVYGDPRNRNHGNLWADMRTLKDRVHGAWLVLGDFNSYLDISGKQGGVPPAPSSLVHFHACVDDCELLEVPVVGDRFTWERRGIKERLDWVFCNMEWEMAHTSFKAYHHLKFNSDHRVVVVSPGESSDRVPRDRSFKYQAAWCLEEGFAKIVEDAWRDLDWMDGRKKFVNKVMEWNDSYLGCLPKKRMKLLHRLEGIDKVLKRNPHNALLRLEDKLWKDYVKVANQEEILWFQKSRCNWLQYGDKNTKFFHTSAKIRRKRNRIEALKNEQGVWVSDQSSLKEMALDYFKRLYTKDEEVLADVEGTTPFPPLGEWQLNQIQSGLQLLK